MKISELCIRRPVMTTLLSLLCVLVGLSAYFYLPISALPSFNSPVITVTADLSGASPESMASIVATPLEKQFSTVPGIITISSNSTQGTTNITIEFDSSRDIDAAAVDVQAAILRAQRALPQEMTTPPSYKKVNPADAPILLLSLTSPSLSLAELDDYAENLISPSLSTVSGVGQVTIYGQKKYAVRIEVDPNKLASRGLTLEDLKTVLRNANDNSPLGVIRGDYQSLIIESNKQLHKASDFQSIIVASYKNQPVRLSDIATVIDSIQTLTNASWDSGEPAIVLAVLKQSDANTVATVDAIKSLMPKLMGQMPSSVQLNAINDRSSSIRESFHDVQVTMALTALLVVMVIYLFLSNLQATAISAITLPICMIGTMALLYYLGYSLDNISLLGLTLAVGLVVDDAIVVLENIVRHLDKGLCQFEAAILGANEVYFTIFSISLSLVAVFIPIFFMPGVVGLLFHEFAVVVMIAVMVSAVVSLTLIPLLCSRFLSNHTATPADSKRNIFELIFAKVNAWYEESLDVAFRHHGLILALTILSIIVSILIFIYSPKGFFPSEDIGQIQGSVVASHDASFKRLSEHMAKINKIFMADDAVDRVVFNVKDATGKFFITLKPKKYRELMDTVVTRLRHSVNQEPGVEVYLQPVQNLRLGARHSNSKYQYVLQSVNGGELNTWADKLRFAVANDSHFKNVSSDAENNGLNLHIEIDKERANTYGISLSGIHELLYKAYGESQVTSIYTANGSYAVIIEVAEPFRKNAASVEDLRVRSSNGDLIPLSRLVKLSRVAGPTSVNHMGQLQAVTISFDLANGVTLSEVAERLANIQASIGLPADILTSYAGDAAAFQQAAKSQILLILAALAVIYVLLGVLYESFIHPITILSGLPSAVIGALIALRLFGFELSVIANIGMLMLIGIVKKNAIMMIDFAIEAKRSGQDSRAAIKEACILRFRPIMMTTLCALMGALPIALGLGAGGELRQPLGIAVSGGLIFSQLITLYVTPILFITLDRFDKSL